MLFVCIENIIRSPVCEGLFKTTVKSDAVVDSAAVTNDDLSHNPNRGSQAVAREKGFDISGHVSRQITDDDFRKFAIIVSLEKCVHRRLLSIAPKDSIAKIG